MPPRKSRVKTLRQRSTSASKRKLEDTSPPATPGSKKKRIPKEEPPTVRIINESIATQFIDRHCWICHQEGSDQSCFKCQRVYHNRCMRKSKQAFKAEACPQCQMESLDGKPLSEKFLKMSQRMKRHLSYIVYHWNKKNPVLSFWEWPSNLGQNKLTTIFDLQRLLDKIRRNHYTKPVQFYGDAKYILHNCCILYKNDKDATVVAANRLLSYFREEVLSMEACLECCFPSNYSASYKDFRIVDPFFQVCDPPHDLVWNKMKTFPYWPAKVIKVIGNTAHIKYFGDKHEKASVSLKDCYFLSSRHPSEVDSIQRNMPKFSGPKSKAYKLARQELEKYINIYEKQYGTYPLDSFPANTIYVPGKIKHKKFQFSEPDDSTDCSSSSSESGGRASCKLKRISTREVSAHDDDMDLSGDDSSSSDEESTSAGSDDPRIETAYSIEGNSSEPNINSGPTITSIGSLNTQFHPPSNRNNNASAGANNLNEDFHEILVSAYAQQGRVRGERVSPSELDSVRDMIRHLQPVTSSVPQIFDVSEDTDSGRGTRGFGRSSDSDSDDNDVIVLKVLPSSGNQMQSFNPNSFLPWIREVNPVLSNYINESNNVFMSLMLRMWAVTSRFSAAPEMLSKVHSETRRMEKEMERYQAICETLQKEKTKAVDDVQMYLSKLENEKAITAEAISYREEHMANAAMVIRGLHIQSEFTMGQVERLKFENKAISDSNKLKDQANQGLNENVEYIQQQIAELESDAAANEIVEEQTPDVNDQYSIIEHKRKDYCCICLNPAAFHCCLDTNYCSLDHQLSDKEHLKKCPNKKIHEQGVSHIRHIKSQTITRARRSSFPGKLEVCIQRETVESRYITRAPSRSKTAAESMTKPPARGPNGRSRKKPRNRT